MTFASKALGDWGEQKACAFLQEKAYKILKTNYRNRLGEIDIVAQDSRGVVIFIEVKTRQSLQCGQPYEAVHHQKMHKLGKLASSFLLDRFKTTEVLSRFDVISIVQDEAGQVTIEHIKNAFDLSPRLN